MSLPDPAVVDAALRRLDTDALAALGADLWTARGFDVASDGDLLVVDDGEDVETVWVVGGRRFGRATAPSEPVDVVLAPGAGRVARRVAAESDARVVDAAALREMLWYAVERPVWRALCAEHLGAAPEALTPPLATRLRVAGRDAAETAEASVDRVAAAPSPLLAVVAVALLVASVGLVGPGLPGGGDTAADEFGALGGLVGLGDDEASAEGEGTGGGAAKTSETSESSSSDGGESDGSGDSGSASEASIAGVESIPGVTRDGIENLSALVAAHDRRVANRSYTLWFDGYRQELGRPETRVQRDVDIRVEGERYLLVGETEANGTRTRVGRVYYDGDDWYVSEPASGNETGSSNGTAGEWRLADPGEAERIGPSPFDYRAFGLRQYLETPNTVIEARMEADDGRTWYRIAGSGPPPGPFAAQMTNYSVVAIVDSEGFVGDLAVEYRVTAEQPYWVRYEWTYGRLDETTVEPQVNETNETNETSEASETGPTAPGLTSPW